MVVLQLSASSDDTRKAADILTEQLLTDLSGDPRFEAIGQSEISALLSLERQKQLLGCSDEATSCIAELGGALGARWLLMGSLGRLGGKLRLDLKLVDTTSAKVASRDGRILDDDSLLFAAASEILAKLTNRPPAPRTKVLPFIVGGAGLAAAVAGSLLMGLASSATATLNENRASIPVSESLAKLQPLQTQYWAGLALASVGGGAIIGAIVMLVLPESQSTAVTVSPTAGGLEVRW
jgi:TolB-like protein